MVGDGKIIWFQAPAMVRDVTHSTTAAWEILTSLSGEDKQGNPDLPVWRGQTLGWRSGYLLSDPAFLM